MYPQAHSPKINYEMVMIVMLPILIFGFIVSLEALIFFNIPHAGAENITNFLTNFLRISNFREVCLQSGTSIEVPGFEQPPSHYIEDEWLKDASVGRIAINCSPPDFRSPIPKWNEEANKWEWKKKYTWCILPAFIDKYCKKKLSDSLFYLGACSSLANDTFWDALKDNGARVAFGWSNPISSTLDVDTFYRLMTLMTQGYSAIEAYFNILSPDIKGSPYNTNELKAN